MTTNRLSQVSQKLNEREKNVLISAKVAAPVVPPSQMRQAIAVMGPVLASAFCVAAIMYPLGEMALEKLAANEDLKKLPGRRLFICLPYLRSLHNCLLSLSSVSIIFIAVRSISPLPPSLPSQSLILHLIYPFLTHRCRSYQRATDGCCQWRTKGHYW